MLENFVENAVKYAPPKSIVALEMRSREQGVEVTVKDTGPGISQELASKIFERFTRGEPSSIVPGSGLGLSIAAEIARLHNVNIDLKSDGRDKGTAVKLTFPPTQPTV
jgi:signal transduction histidine kinase